MTIVVILIRSWVDIYSSVYIDDSSVYIDDGSVYIDVWVDNDACTHHTLPVKGSS